MKREPSGRRHFGLSDRVRKVFEEIEGHLAREHSPEELAAAEAACRKETQEVQAELQFAPHGRG